MQTLAQKYICQQAELERLSVLETMLEAELKKVRDQINNISQEAVSKNEVLTEVLEGAGYYAFEIEGDSTGHQSSDWIKRIVTIEGFRSTVIYDIQFDILTVDGVEIERREPVAL